MHHTDKYSQRSSIIWPVWLDGWVFAYDLSGFGFEYCFSRLGKLYLLFKKKNYLGKIFLIAATYKKKKFFEEVN